MQRGIVETVNEDPDDVCGKVHYMPHHAIMRQERDTTKVEVSHTPAITADIEKAFLMVSVAIEDRDVLRFLWFDDVLSDQPNIVKLRFTRVVFGMMSSPSLLNATICHHLEQYRETQPDLVEKLSKAVYVDDIVSGADDEGQAHKLFREAKEILAEGGFNLHSNSALLN